MQLKEGFWEPKWIDETDDETGDEQLGRIDMPDLESEESDEQRRNQERKGLKNLTLNQMLSRSPNTIAQLKAGNNSEKLKKWNNTTITFFVWLKKNNKNNL